MAVGDINQDGKLDLASANFVTGDGVSVLVGKGNGTFIQAPIFAAGGIMITASHNPYRWNGIKFKASYGSSASPAIVAQIEKELHAVLAGDFPALPPRKELIHSLDVRAPYLETLESLADWERLRAAKLRFLVDPMHGAARGLLREILARHGVVTT